MTTKDNKPKILLVGWELHLDSVMRDRELKQLAEKFTILIADSAVYAMELTAKFKLFDDHTPIRGFVFNRNMMVTNTMKCKFLIEFAEYDAQMVSVVNMIESDQDVEGRAALVRARYATVNDWKQVERHLDDIL